MRIVELTDESKNNILENLLKRSPNSYGKFESAVAEILLNIKTKGDEALFEYTKNFDKADINADNIVVTEAEIEEAYTLVDPELIDVIRKAIRETYAVEVFESSYEKSANREVNIKKSKKCIILL